MNKIRRRIKALLYLISPKLLVSIKYFITFHRVLKWRNPTDLNEKINWLKFNSDTSLWTLCADKYRVREYIHDKGLDYILVKLFGKWDRAEDIDFDALPNSFVLKTNNGSGDIFVCDDKSKLDKLAIKQRYSQLLDLSFSEINGEPHYAAIIPCIIVEEVLDCQKQPIETDTLIDYKIWCFNGKPHCIWVCYNRHKDNVEVGTYDLDWNYHKEWSVFTSHYIESTKTLPKPKSLEKMLEIARILSADIPQVRIDLYEVDGKPYFGEMTFTSSGGMNNFYSRDFLLEMGSQITLSK